VSVTGGWRLVIADCRCPASGGDGTGGPTPGPLTERHWCIYDKSLSQRDLRTITATAARCDDHLVVWASFLLCHSGGSVIIISAAERSNTAIKNTRGFAPRTCGAGISQGGKDMGSRETNLTHHPHVNSTQEVYNNENTK